MQNLVKCDRCGKIEKLKFNGIFYALPDSFHRINEDLELCDDCYQEYKKLLEKLIENF